jgi:PBP1b-binding outer membrane lipoprotein LpoB
MHRGNERVIVLVLLTILVFVGCSSLMATPIIEIRENPRASTAKPLPSLARSPNYSVLSSSSILS